MNCLTTLWRRYGELFVIAVVLIVFAVAVAAMVWWLHDEFQACGELGWDVVECLARFAE